MIPAAAITPAAAVPAPAAISKRCICKKRPQGRLRIRKHTVLPAPIWLKCDRKKCPIRQYRALFAADFISNIHWQNCFAPEKDKFCAGSRRGDEGMLTHGKSAQQRYPCKICLLRRVFSYVEPAKGSLFCAAKTPWLSLARNDRFFLPHNLTDPRSPPPSAARNLRTGGWKRTTLFRPLRRCRCCGGRSWAGGRR